MSEHTPARPIDVEAASRRLRLFRVMAFVVGLGLLVLVAELVLKHRFHNDALAWWPQPHGLIFVLYAASVVALGFALRWRLEEMVLLILAGCVPFLSFWVERRTTARAQAQIDAAVAGHAPEGLTAGR